MNRRQEREQTFLFTFEHSFHSHRLDEIIELKRIIDGDNFEISEFTERVFKGIIEHKAEIDAVIEKYVIGWRKERISKVTIAILRLAIYEIMFEEDIPNSVSINEAVELAKKYSTQDDASFINGILRSALPSNR